MKKISNILLVLGICSAFCFSACVDKFAIGDAFVVKPYRSEAALLLVLMLLAP